jgi:hypothetical protein
MNTVMTERPERVSMKHACHALTLNRSTVYARRHRAAHTEPPRRSRRYAAQPRALSEVEQATVIDTLHSEAYCDQPPAGKRPFQAVIVQPGPDRISWDCGRTLFSTRVGLNPGPGLPDVR